jgi:hypothetical protein
MSAIEDALLRPLRLRTTIERIVCGCALAFGLLLTVGGLCDHFLLHRTFKRQGMEATHTS